MELLIHRIAPGTAIDADVPVDLDPARPAATVPQSTNSAAVSLECATPEHALLTTSASTPVRVGFCTPVNEKRAHDAAVSDSPSGTGCSEKKSAAPYTNPVAVQKEKTITPVRVVACALGNENRAHDAVVADSPSGAVHIEKKSVVSYAEPVVVHKEKAVEPVGQLAFLFPVEGEVNGRAKGGTRLRMDDPSMFSNTC